MDYAVCWAGWNRRYLERTRQGTAAPANLPEMLNDRKVLRDPQPRKDVRFVGRVPKVHQPAGIRFDEHGQGIAMAYNEAMVSGLDKASGMLHGGRSDGRHDFNQAQNILSW